MNCVFVTHNMSDFLSLYIQSREVYISCLENSYQYVNSIDTYKHFLILNYLIDLRKCRRLTYFGDSAHISDVYLEYGSLQQSLGKINHSNIMS